MIKNKRCIKTIFSRVILCAGNMNDYLTIYDNTLQPIGISDNQAKPEKVILHQLFGAIENVNSSARYAGVKMTPNSPEGKSSHVVYIPFSQDIYELDVNKLFIEVERTRNRLFKMNKIQDLNEQEQYLAIWCNETGFSNLEAAEA